MTKDALEFLVSKKCDDKFDILSAIDDGPR